MPSKDINEFWIGKPSARKPQLQANAKKRRKRIVGQPGPSDGSTGIFDSSSDEDLKVDGDTVTHPKTKISLPNVLSIQAHQRAFEAAWLTLLPLLANDGDIKRVLVVIHRLVIPHLANPVILMDFLSDCCDLGAFGFVNV